MFEKYTEKARRVIFFARYEASEFGANAIGAEHLLLGLVREDPKLLKRFDLNVNEIRSRIEQAFDRHDKIPASVDLPLSSHAKHALNYAAEESEMMRDRHIGTEHLLAGLLRETKSIASEILQELGLNISTLRKGIERGASEKSGGTEIKSEESLISLVQEMRNLAMAILQRCNQVEDRLNALSNEEGKTE